MILGGQISNVHHLVNFRICQNQQKTTETTITTNINNPPVTTERTTSSVSERPNRQQTEILVEK